MKLAMIGLGRMGANMAERLIQGGHEVVGYDPSADARKRVEGFGARTADSPEKLAGMLSEPRIAWIMVPAGDPVDATISALRPLFSKNDIIIDGGNSNYKATMSRADSLAAFGIHYVDAGVSGGALG